MPNTRKRQGRLTAHSCPLVMIFKRLLLSVIQIIVRLKRLFATYSAYLIILSRQHKSGVESSVESNSEHTTTRK